MKKNVGPNERLARIALGAAALTAALLATKAGAFRIPLALAGVSGLLTGVMQHCPLSTLAGISNGEGEEFIHFEEKSDSSFGHRANVWQQSHGMIIHA